MKAICKIKAYYNGAIIKPGETVNIKGKKLPSWAKAIKEIAPEEVNEEGVNDEGVNDNEAPVEETPVEETPVEEAPVEEAPEEVVEPDQPFQEDTPEEVNEGVNDEENAPEEDDLTGKTEVELSAILDELLTQALDKGIEIEIGTKPIIDSIIELRQKLKEVNEGVNV